ncbi:membrane dipeptidase [Spirosoma endbachense]|uniref:Peptidase M19 n=1 Tax=Spirosoma endbachense TaxID=2666025 RepID=A0A6P1VX77_9BACT|nr:membrane dipeptidase [Spirosoma endbachense]QHV96430.1 hypothetical protein GJR95_15995 [Spirosoma endbachense]
MPYFDLHCHPFLRPTWIKGFQPDQVFTVKINPGNVNFVQQVVINAFGKPLETILDSQSCLTHINRADPGGAKVVVATLFAMENSYANLKFCGFNRVLRFIEGMNIGQLQEIGDTNRPDAISYHTLLQRELAVVEDFGNRNFGPFRCQIVNSFDDIDPGPDVINILVNMEGGHNFYGRVNVLDQETLLHRAEVTQALADWKQAAFRSEVPRLLYITVTHHTTNCLTNHAFGVPGRFAGDGTNPNAGGFNPHGNRITDEGLNFIRTALRQTDEEDRILIDLKHMSIQARRQWYRFREKLINEEGFTPIPLVASHMGVTGLSWLDPTVATCNNFLPDPECFEVFHDDSLALLGFRLKEDGPEDLRLKFNPWSINLYNEEIELIVESGGLIGLSFDDRILGNSPFTESTERFSRHEINVTSSDPLDHFPLPSIADIDFNHPVNGNPAINRVDFPHTNRSTNGIFAPNYPDDAIFGNLSFGFLEQQKGLLSLCQNIIHIVRVGGPNAWNCICIGSDYDGIMDAIDAVPNASAVASMRSNFTSFIGRMVGALNQHITNEGIEEPLLTLPGDFYERFLFENAHNFLKTHFTRQIILPNPPQEPNI